MNCEMYAYTNDAWREHVLHLVDGASRNDFWPSGPYILLNIRYFFECNNETACESNPQGLPDPTRIVNSPKHILPRDRNDPGARYKAVSFYSSTQLTYAKGNLVAISGVARHIQSMTGDEYVSGLWRTGIEMQLCWRVDRDKIKPTELGSPAPASLAQTLATPLPYPGPSWSWASVEEAISWELNGFPCWVEVIPVGDDSMRQLKNAKLEAKCGPFITGNAIMSQMELYKQTSKHGLDDREENSSPLFKADGYIWLDHEYGDQQQSVASLFFLPVIEYMPTSWNELISAVS
ncbi:uncharacterized protein PAC_12534 [Phialocephala subalpina]|uniref:Heterokaryon incompatibility domain-containing protein n=1 Tax=Phialocephala subalpina TaxID=576137 RepID=A0A1L7XCD9_9HELO|nr:uncharacterized protein PAC_12534 [Phialocephala subalpina]